MIGSAAFRPSDRDFSKRASPDRKQVSHCAPWLFGCYTESMGARVWKFSKNQNEKMTEAIFGKSAWMRLDSKADSMRCSLPGISGFSRDLCCFWGRGDKQLSVGLSIAETNSAAACATQAGFPGTRIFRRMGEPASIWIQGQHDEGSAHTVHAQRL